MALLIISFLMISPVRAHAQDFYSTQHYKTRMPHARRDTQYDVSFRLWDSQQAGHLAWTQDAVIRSDSDGFIEACLGALPTLFPTTQSTYYLEILTTSTAPDGSLVQDATDYRAELQMGHRFHEDDFHHLSSSRIRIVWNELYPSQYCQNFVTGGKRAPVFARLDDANTERGFWDFITYRIGVVAYGSQLRVRPLVTADFDVLLSSYRGLVASGTVAGNPTFDLLSPTVVMPTTEKVSDIYWRQLSSQNSWADLLSPRRFQVAVGAVLPIPSDLQGHFYFGAAYRLNSFANLDFGGAVQQGKLTRVVGLSLDIKSIIENITH